MGTGSDIWIPRLVVCFLGMASLASIVAGAIIASMHGEIPPVISGLGTSALSTLGVVAIALYGKPYGNGGGNSPTTIVTK